MSRLVRLGATLALAFAISAIGGAHDADAKAKKKKPPAKVVKKVEKVAPPNAEQKKALGELMGTFKFGMSKDEVLVQLSKSIDERYADQIKATSDIATQDRLRRDKNKEITRIKSSYTEFKGKSPGWDVSVITDEFRHNTDESMLEYWENQGGKNQRRFFFFHDGQLWKMFIAIDTKQLQDDQRNFAFFRGLMEARYGKGATVDGRAVWKTADFEVNAIDKMSFYGQFALSIQSPSQAKAIAEIRAANAPVEKKTDGLIDVIREKPDDKVNLDENKDSVDAIISGSK
jgi:hypothetical protein